MKERANYDVVVKSSEASIVLLPLPKERVFHDSLTDEAKGVTYWVGDFVYVPNPELDRPSIVQSERLFTSKKGDAKFFSGNYFFYPEQTSHPPGRKFFEREVFKTTSMGEENLSNITGKCHVMYIKEYVRGG